MELFNRFIPLCDSVLRTVLHGLSTAITGQSDEFDAAHDPGNANNSTLMLLHYPKQSGSTNVGHNKHTDLGSLTLVLTRQGGLQVWMPETMTWQFVEPRVGHAVVNVGDSLRFLSGNRLYSALHRVLPTERQTLESRYSICYFLRPGDEVKFKDMEGREVTGQQWHDEKHKMFQTTHEQQSKSLLLTGGMEQILGNVGTLE
jgi:isopenicillin N synthase-like dioxygenase